MQLQVANPIQNVIPLSLSPTENQGGSALGSGYRKGANAATDSDRLAFSLLALPACAYV